MTEDQSKQPAVSENLMNDIRMIENMAIIPELLNVVCRTTGMRFAAVAKVTDEKWVACVTQDDIAFGLKTGDSLSPETTLCHQVKRTQQPVVIDHVAIDPVFKDHPVPPMYGFQSYISVPIITKDGGFFGTICAADPDPNRLSTPEVRDMFKLFSELISFHIDAAKEADHTADMISRERDLHKKIEANEQKLNMIIESSELGVFEVDLVTKQIKHSPRYLETLGRAKDEHPTWDELRSQTHKDDLPLREKAYKESFVDGKFNYSGRIFWPDNSMHWIESKGKVFFDEEGNPVSVTGTVRDITAERNSAAVLEGKVRDRTKELYDKNEELEKMNKELESFTYISGHDLQEPLRKIQSFISLLEADENSLMSDKEKDYFSRMKNAANRMQMLIHDLLTYSRATTAERIYEDTDLNDIIGHLKEDMREELQQKNAVIETNGLCVLRVIPFQMHQLFQNLVSNSLKFAAEDRVPYIKIETEKASADQLKAARLPTDKDYCLIKVSDNGIGFEPQYNERIFELFQRLHAKAAYIGTGIGLAIVKKIVENHDGAVTAEGKAGEGAVFNIYLPAE